jgi:hypothetical protein
MSQDPEFGIILMSFTWLSWEAFICRKCRFYFSGWCCLLIVYIHVSREGCAKTPVNGKILSHMQLQHTHPHLHCYTQHNTAHHITSQHTSLRRTHRRKHTESHTWAQVISYAHAENSLHMRVFKTSAQPHTPTHTKTHIGQHSTA